jgi:pimeloyl-ACP methyl ester carboxylesterase
MLQQILICAQIVTVLICAFLLMLWGHRLSAALLWALPLSQLIIFSVIALATLTGFAVANHFNRGFSQADWRTVLTEFKAKLNLFMRNMVWHKAFDHQVLKNAQTPILFVHGYGCNQQSWLDFMRAANAAGHEVDALDLEPVFGSIEQYVPLIDAAVKQLQTDSGYTQIYLVAHSMGGLATRAYCRTQGHAALKHIVSLGTPHGGTQLARLGLGGNAQQMSPGNPWRLQLDRDLSSELAAKWTAYIATVDNIVMPADQQTLAGAENIWLDKIGHLALMQDAAVIAQVLGRFKHV